MQRRLATILVADGRRLQPSYGSRWEAPGRVYSGSPAPAERVLTRFLARRWPVAPRLFAVLSSPLPRRVRPGASLRLAHHWRYQTNLWRGRTSPARQQVPLRLHPPCPGFDVSKRRYKIVVATEKSVKTFKVLCAVTAGKHNIPPNTNPTPPPLPPTP